jgi:hypothetical protein
MTPAERGAILLRVEEAARVSEADFMQSREAGREDADIVLREWDALRAEDPLRAPLARLLYAIFSFAR